MFSFNATNVINVTNATQTRIANPPNVVCDKGAP
jgi:hypothetical protein